jgi:hypothetical protein
VKRYYVYPYMDGPATRWLVIDRSTQEWVRRCFSEEAAEAYAAKLEAKMMSPREKGEALKQMKETAEFYEALEAGGLIP